MNKIKNVQILVMGRVQGVGFRYYSVMKAKEYRISGYVKNLYDGSVFIEAEGTDTDLDDFILWCQRGPSSSRVDKIDLTPGVIRNYNNFSIRH